MAEMIVPGTYITVRPEGLISAGRIATGIVGVVGTAARGGIGEPVTLAGFADARERFGASDDFDRPEEGTPLTLVRALEHIYANGASTVLAVRVAGASRSSANFAVQRSLQTVAVLEANSPGSWGNSIKVEIDPAEDNCRVTDETHDTTFDALVYSPIVPSAENRIRVFRGITKRFETYDIVYQLTIRDEEVTLVGSTYQLANTPVEQVNEVNQIRIVAADGTETTLGTGDILYNSVDPPAAGEVNVNTTTGELAFGTAPAADATVFATYAAGHAAPQSGQVRVTTWDGSLDYAAGEAPEAGNGDELTASYLVDRAACVQVTLVYEAITETYNVPDGRLLAQRINQSSALATAEADETNGNQRPDSGLAAFFGTGSNVPGSNGADAGRDEYTIGLESLANQLINIVVLAGQDAAAMGSLLEGHLNATEQTDHERIGVIGAAGSTLPEYLGHTVSNDRIVLVAPGLAYPGGPTLPAPYTAAAIAGLISSLAPQTSLTNKTVTLPDLDLIANRGQQEQLIKANLLSVVLKNNAFRVLKGITTEGEGAPFSAIPTRRIVDFAKYGVRSAADPYIGRLNNARVRAALQATLEGFLTRMVDDEQLTGFELSVTATRAQEIAGEVNVEMTLQPTFSIDFVRVTMTLQ